MGKIPPLRIAVVVGIAAVLFGLYIFAQSGKKPPPPPAVSLTLWGTEAPAIVEKLTAAYTAYRPNVTITYRQIPAGRYDSQLLEALASGTGPDVFFIKNSSIPREISRLVPANPTQITNASVKSLFPSAVAEDVILGGKIYALPVNFDTLVLLGNRDLLDQIGMVNPPTTWNEILAQIPKLRILDAKNNITRAAIALGESSASVRHASDILSLLMLQNGTPMFDRDRTKAMFDSSVGTSTPGLGALNFYLQFANGGSPNYTWNSSLGNSEDAFASGKTVFVLGYRTDIPNIRRKSPFLKITVSSAPQSREDFAVNLARYDVLAVSRQSRAQDWAWDFAILSATTPAIQKEYHLAGDHTTGILSELAEVAKLPNGEFISRAALTARTWHQADDRAITRIFDEMIGGIRSNERSPHEALRYAASRISELLRTSY